MRITLFVIRDARSGSTMRESSQHTIYQRLVNSCECPLYAMKLLIRFSLSDEFASATCIWPAVQFRRMDHVFACGGGGHNRISDSEIRRLIATCFIPQWWRDADFIHHQKNSSSHERNAIRVVYQGCFPIPCPSLKG